MNNPADVIVVIVELEVFTRNGRVKGLVLSYTCLWVRLSSWTCDTTRLELPTG